eukprot:11088141-Alexandrium_andersonii.AAC.1
MTAVQGVSRARVLVGRLEFCPQRWLSGVYRRRTPSLQGCAACIYDQKYEPKQIDYALVRGAGVA